jgi:hypothetical protein
MSKIHIWAGNFSTKKLFDTYSDQKKYLKAWAKYDNEPPTGNEADDAEPDPSLRCAFCKEVNLDMYDEDLITLKYYTRPTDVNRMADDLLVDSTELEKLFRKHSVKQINSVIAYEDNDLSVKNASRSTSIQYLGQLKKITAAGSEDLDVHHLWIGENKLTQKQITKEIGLNKDEVININFYHTAKEKKLDEMIIIQVEEYEVAEKMILKLDKMKISPVANAILDLKVAKGTKINGAGIGDALGMKYIGQF